MQSGDDSVLRLMRRGYDRDRYLQIVRRIREALPDAVDTFPMQFICSSNSSTCWILSYCQSITADCIVGFPGETEEQFQNTLSLMEEVS